MSTGGACSPDGALGYSPLRAERATACSERSGSRLTERVASNGARLADITALFLPKSSQTRSVRHKSLRWLRRCGGGAVWGARVCGGGGVWRWRGALERSQAAGAGRAASGARQGTPRAGGGAALRGATHRPARVRQSPDPSVSTEAGACWC